MDAKPAADAHTTAATESRRGRGRGGGKWVLSGTTPTPPGVAGPCHPHIIMVVTTYDAAKAQLRRELEMKKLEFEDARLREEGAWGWRATYTLPDGAGELMIVPAPGRRAR
jgi:hypothetical protein